MENQKLNEWLKRLYVVFNFQATDGLIREYLYWLSRWRLSDQEWEQVMELVVYECQFFPSILELWERKVRVVEQRPSPEYETFERDGIVYARRKKKEVIQ